MSTFLNRIAEKLEQEKYETPVQFIQDMRRIFVKVWIYYLKATSFYQHSNKVVSHLLLSNQFDLIHF